jgi:hypothetical protein
MPDALRADVLHVSRIDFGQESLSGFELKLLIARIKRLETQGGGGTAQSIEYVAHSVVGLEWVADISKCIVFYGLTEDTTLENAVFANQANVFRIGNNSPFMLSLSGTGNIFTLTPYEYATARYVDGGWIYVTGIN